MTVMITLYVRIARKVRNTMKIMIDRIDRKVGSGFLGRLDLPGRFGLLEKLGLL